MLWSNNVLSMFSRTRLIRQIFVNLLNLSLFRQSRQNSYLLCTFCWSNSSPFSIPEKCFIRLIRHLQFYFRCLSSYYVWEFKQIEDLYLRIAALFNLFIGFIHKVRSVTRIPNKRMRKSLLSLGLEFRVTL